MNSICRKITPLILFLLCAIIISGCGSQKMGDKPGDEMNSGMSAQQKAINAEHKKRGEQ